MQRWLDDPSTNAGWILIGEESAPSTAKRFDSAQIPQLRARPELVVGFDTLPTSISCRRSQVGAGQGLPEEVLMLNGSTGAFQTRVVQVAIGAPIAVDLAASSAGPNPGPFVLYLQLGAPTPSTVITLPSGLGLMCFPSPVIGGTAFKIWNNIGRRNRIGHPDFPSSPAPSTVVNAPSGSHRAVTATLQGILLDNGSRADYPASVTNAIVLEVL